LRIKSILAFVDKELIDEHISHYSKFFLTSVLLLLLIIIIVFFFFDQNILHKITLVQGGRKEECSGWGTRVYLWWIHVDIWQNQYNIVELKN